MGRVGGSGFALAAPVFGWLLDHGYNGGVFAGASLALMMGVASAALVAQRVRQGALTGLAAYP